MTKTTLENHEPLDLWIVIAELSEEEFTIEAHTDPFSARAAAERELASGAVRVILAAVLASSSPESRRS